MVHGTLLRGAGARKRCGALKGRTAGVPGRHAVVTERFDPREQSRRPPRAASTAAAAAHNSGHASSSSAATMAKPPSGFPSAALSCLGAPSTGPLTNAHAA